MVAIRRNCDDVGGGRVGHRGPFRVLSCADYLRGRRQCIRGEEEGRVALWSDPLRCKNDGRVHGAPDRTAVADCGAVALGPKSVLDLKGLEPKRVLNLKDSCKHGARRL